LNKLLIKELGVIFLKSNNYINVIGFSLIIILTGINEKMIYVSSISKLLLNIVILTLGVVIVTINLKMLIGKNREEKLQL
jgi:heme/copper-type cytochrome/quinol oxidase subunit 4